MPNKLYVDIIKIYFMPTSKIWWLISSHYIDKKQDNSYTLI